MNQFSLTALTGILLSATLVIAAPPPELKAKVEKRIAELQVLCTDATIVSETKAYNAAPPSGMTNDKWKALTVISPEVKALTKSTLGVYLKGKKAVDIAEMFVNGADGGKVALISKTTSWTHKGKPKHDLPMAGKTWIGDVEMDESSGKQSIQFSIPVLDGGKAIGSIVIGLAVAELK
jgi:hypothetical protein